MLLQARWVELSCSDYRANNRIRDCFCPYYTQIIAYINQDFFFTLHFIKWTAGANLGVQPSKQFVLHQTDRHTYIKQMHECTKMNTDCLDIGCDLKGWYL